MTVEEGLSYPITLQMTEDKSCRLWIATYMDGIWNSVPSTFSFEIRSSLWGTWYFIVIMALTVLAGITIFFRIRIRLIQTKREELERIVEEKTHEARTQNKQLEKQKEEIIAQTERLQTSYNNLENLSEIGKVITSQLSIEKIIDTVYDTINNLMDATVFGIGIVNKENNSIDFSGKFECLDQRKG